MPVSGLAVGAVTAGSLLLYAGLKGYSIPHAVQAVISGKPPSAGGVANPITGAGTGSGGGGGGGGSAPAAPTSVSGNVAMGKMMAAARGWTGPEWNALYALWEAESSWSTTALNPGTGATGIPQLNPGSHTIPANWSSPAVQIQWGLNYIASRYGDPEGAWAHEESYGWY